MSEREKDLEQERERDQLSEIIFVSLAFTFDSHSISEEVAVFSPLCFPRGKYLCPLSLVIACCAFYSLR